MKNTGKKEKTNSNDFEKFITKVRKIVSQLKREKRIEPSSITLSTDIKKLTKGEDGLWQFHSSYLNNTQKEIWHSENIKIIQSKMSKEDTDFFKPYIRNTVLAILEKDKKRLDSLRNEYQRAINKENLYSITTYNTMGCSYDLSKLKINIKNKDNIPIEIIFLPVSICDITTILSQGNVKFQPDTFDLVFYGLKIQINVVQDYFEKEVNIQNIKMHCLCDKNSNIKFSEYKIATIILKLLYPTVVNEFFITYHNEGHETTTLNTAVPIKDIINCSSIKKPDRNLLKKDYTFFHNKLIQYKVIDYPNEKKVISSLYVALEKYDEALNIPSREFEKLITYIIMGLEAIYTSKDEDLAYTLRMRIVTILNLLNRKEKNSIEILKKAYSIRCDYAHGNINREKLKRKLLEYFNSDNAEKDCIYYFLNILRISIVLVIIFDFGKNISSKQNDIVLFQKMLDDVMLGDKVQIIEIKQKLKDFKGWLRF